MAKEDSIEDSIEITEKPVFIISGPGSGKTELILRKVKHLVEVGFDEERILGVTFTEKAAEEMKERAASDYNVVSGFMTFHSFAFEILEEKGLLSRENKVLEKPLAMVNLMDRVGNYSFNTFEHGYKVNKVEDAYSLIIKFKEYGFTLDDVKAASFKDENIKEDFVKIFGIYEEFKREKGLVDYCDVLLMLRDKLENDEGFREEMKTRFEYLLVDEFQDTNRVQLDILKRIAVNNITMVGDPKQSIYSFRGASIDSFSVFMEFLRDYRVFYNSVSYRLSEGVASAVNGLVENDDEKIRAMNEGGSFEVYKCSDENSGFNLIEEVVKESQGTVGVLCRNNQDCNEVSRFLKGKGVPHSVSSSRNIFGNAAVRRILNIMRVVYDKENSGAELFEVLERFVADKRRLKIVANRVRGDFYGFLKEGKMSDVLEEEEVSRVGDFVERLERIIESRDRGVSYVVTEVVREFGFYEECVSLGDFEGVSSIKKFIEYVEEFSRVHGDEWRLFFSFCEMLKGIDFEDGEEGSSVNVMTLHKAKGRQFDTVIMPFMNDRKIPGYMRRNYFDKFFENVREEFLSEERNLFFVGATRARQRVVVGYVEKYSRNTKASAPTRFLKEVEAPHVEYRKDVLLDENREEFYGRVRKFLVRNEYDRAINEIKREKDRQRLSRKDASGGLFNYMKGENELVDKSKLYLSPSKIECYLNCPKQFLYAHVYRVPTLEKYYFSFGKSLHDVLEKLMKNYVYKGGAVSAPENVNFGFLYKKFVELLKESWREEGYESREQMKEYFEKAVKVGSDVIRFELDRMSERELIGVEKWLKFNLSEFEVGINGIIDRVDKTNTGYEIIDYKTSRSIKSKKDLREDVQLFIYKVGFERVFGNKVSSIALWYLLHDSYVQVYSDEIDEEKVKGKIDRAVNGIKEEKFEAQPSFLCNFCDYKNICKDAWRG